MPQRVEVDGKALPSLGAWAKGAGLCPSTISKILGGKRTPKVDTLERMASTMGVRPDRLWQWIQEHAA
jgi:transcriptional regulator with XRE-family HTH domain